MDPDSIIKILVIFLFLILSAFFSSAETALSMVNRVRLKSIAEDDDEAPKKRRSADRALVILDDYGQMLSAVLIGNNIVNLGASALVTTLAIEISVPVGIATLILTILVLLFCEIVPKNISANKAEVLSLRYSGIILIYIKILAPVVIVIDAIASIFLKMLKIDPNDHEAMTESELRTYVDVSHEDGVIESDEKEMIINVFDFGDSVARDIMIPRIDMTTINVNATFGEVWDTFRRSMYTRLPVYENDNDNIIGLVNIKDFILIDEEDDYDIHKILRKGYYTYELKKTADLLSEMRKKSESVAFVLNEYGSCEGMITLEDLLEEIVGEIRDEYDADELDKIQKMSVNTYLIDGTMKLDDINDKLKCDLSSEDYDSIGGLVIECLGDRLPEDGDSITTEAGDILKVQGVDANRVLKVLLTVADRCDTIS